MAKARNIESGNFLAFATLAILAFAICLLGASAPTSSVLISFLLMSLTGFFVWYEKDSQPNALVFIMICLLLGIFLVHSLSGFTKGKAAEYLMALTAIFVFWLGDNSIKRGAKPQIIWLGILLLGLIFSIFALFQHVFSPAHIFGIERPIHQGRLSGTFLSSNTASTFLGMIVLASLAHLYRNWRLMESKAGRVQVQLFADFLQRTIIGTLTFLFSFSALLLTASRAGITITLFAILLLAIILASQRRTKTSQGEGFRLGSSYYWIFGLVLIALLFWGLSGSSVSSRYGTMLVDYQQRQDMIEACWTAFQYKPIFGHGFGHLNDAKLLGTTPLNNTHVMWETAAHNFYLQTLVQSGIVGLILIAVLYLFIIVSIYRGIKRNIPYSTYLVAVVLMSFIISSHAMFDYALEIPAVMLFHAWILGLGYGIQQRYL